MGGGELARLKLDLSGIDELEMQLSKLSSTDISMAVVGAGAQPLADEIRKSLDALPEDKFRRLKPNEVFSGVPKQQKRDLQNSLGVTPAKVDRNGNANIKVGFDGYGSFKTKKYPNGLPNQLLARSIESGSSVRVKTPFARVGALKAKNKVIKAMQDELDKQVRKITN